MVFEIVGSYRRNKAAQGSSIDIIMTPSGDLKKTGACFFGSNKTIELSEINGILPKLVKELEVDQILHPDKFMAEKTEKTGA